MCVLTMQKRAKLREELDLARYETESDVDDLPDQAAKGDNKSTKVYKGPSAITTVTTSALHMYSDESVPSFTRTILLKCS